MPKAAPPPVDLNPTRSLSDKKAYRLVRVGAIRVLLIDDPAPVALVSEDVSASADDDDDDVPESSASGYESSAAPSAAGGEGGNASACIAWAFPVGSFDDPSDLQGLAHFCEHMIFSERLLLLDFCA